MISDFHLHTEFSGDSDTPVREQVERAVSLGMKEICITDHHDYDADFTDIDFYAGHRRLSSLYETDPGRIQRPDPGWDRD